MSAYAEPRVLLLFLYTYCTPTYSNFLISACKPWHYCKLRDCNSTQNINSCICDMDLHGMCVQYTHVYTHYVLMCHRSTFGLYMPMYIIGTMYVIEAHSVYVHPLMDELSRLILDCFVDMCVLFHTNVVFYDFLLSFVFIWQTINENDGVWITKKTKCITFWFCCFNIQTSHRSENWLTD